MEATLFTGWIYDFMRPFARELKVGNPQKLAAISTAKKKSDSIDAAMLADLLRCNLIPECYMLPGISSAKALRATRVAGTVPVINTAPSDRFTWRPVVLRTGLH